MNVLIVGSGGREHAIAWKITQSPHVKKIFVAPGNAGTALEPKTTNVAIKPTEVNQLLEFAIAENIDLTIIGPEVALAAGVADIFNQAGKMCFGPTKAAAQLESSKQFCKALLTKHHIPTAKYATFSHSEAAISYLKQQTYPIVIKADGLAAGKGVVIAQNFAEANSAVQQMLDRKQFGDASQSIVIEEFLSGEELSYIVLTDGKHILPLASSQDHKRRDDGNKGPNTGGMGAISPAPLINDTLETKILNTVIKPTINALASEGIHYCGFLYAGLMISKDQSPYVLEFNCRLGDPETQAIIMRLQSDLTKLCIATLDGTLKTAQAKWDPRVAINVVMAASGYPNKYKTGEIINGLPKDSLNNKIFHAGTTLKNNQIIATGGRILSVSALGKTNTCAREIAYNVMENISLNNVFYRHDIGLCNVLQNS